MSEFVDSLSDRIEALEQKVQAFPEKLDSILARLDRGKWENLLARVNEDFNKLLDKLYAPRINSAFAIPLIFDLQSLSITPVTSEDRSKWRTAHKSDIRVVIGKGRVQVMSASEIAGKSETAASQITAVARQEGCIVLSWDQYQRLLDEIGKLVSGNHEQGKQYPY